MPRSPNSNLLPAVAEYSQEIKDKKKQTNERKRMRDRAKRWEGKRETIVIIPKNGNIFIKNSRRKQAVWQSQWWRRARAHTHRMCYGTKCSVPYTVGKYWHTIRICKQTVDCFLMRMLAHSAWNQCTAQSSNHSVIHQIVSTKFDSHIFQRPAHVCVDKMHPNLAAGLRLSHVIAIFMRPNSMCCDLVGSPLCCYCLCYSVCDRIVSRPARTRNSEFARHANRINQLRAGSDESGGNLGLPRAMVTLFDWRIYRRGAVENRCTRRNWNVTRAANGLWRFHSFVLDDPPSSYSFSHIRFGSLLGLPKRN